MTAAVIDLGTNTFHLIIADLSGQATRILYKTNEPVRLGQGRINENIIVPEAFERGIQTLKAFKLKIAQYNVTIVKAIATSAVRSAGNGVAFVKAAKEEAGIDIEVITGEEEASYIYSGVKATGVIKGTSLIMDIGGGSTEFIICNEASPLWKKSYNIGAARLMQAFFNSDPINNGDQSAIISHLDQELIGLKEACALHRPQHLIGSAGAFETFAQMLYKDLDLAATKSAAIDLKAYQSLAEKLISSTHAERDNMPDLIKLRIDMIVMASMITSYVISNCSINSFSLSTYDLKMGVLYQLTS